MDGPCDLVPGDLEWRAGQRYLVSGDSCAPSFNISLSFVSLSAVDREGDTPGGQDVLRWGLDVASVAETLCLWGS